MPRNEAPHDPAYRDESPKHAQARLRALEQLARDQHEALIAWHRLHGGPSENMEDLERRACELLGLDRPRSNHAIDDDSAEWSRSRPVWVRAFEQETDCPHPLVYVPRYTGPGTTIHVCCENIRRSAAWP